MPAPEKTAGSVAVPLLFRFELPSCVVPSKKLTVPEGTPDDPVTFAFNETELSA